MKKISKNARNTITGLIFTLLVVSTCFLILISSLFYFLYNPEYYRTEYLKLNISRKFNIDEGMGAILNILQFFKTDGKLDSSFFSVAEMLHLEDVKKIILGINWIYGVSAGLTLAAAAYLLIYEKKNKAIFYISSAAVVSGISVILLILVALLFSHMLGFNFIFLKFHLVFFEGNYAFDPEVSNMKALFPDEFFLDISTAVLTRAAIKAAFLIVIGILARLPSSVRLLSQFF